MSYYFTADTHFFHKNICKYAERPFLSVEEMNEALIKNWNKTIKPDDIVHHLGDFAFGDSDCIFKILKRLNGRIYFIFGNHDKGLKDFFKRAKNYNKYLKNIPILLGDYKKIKIDNQNIILMHYAMRVWDKSHYSSWNLYGHSHGNLPDDPHSLSLDVGVDCHNYKPISFNEIKIIMSKKLYKPIDHHGEKLPEGGVGLSKEDYAKADRKRLYEQLKREFKNE